MGQVYYLHTRFVPKVSQLQPQHRNPRRIIDLQGGPLPVLSIGLNHSTKNGVK